MIDLQNINFHPQFYSQEFKKQMSGTPHPSTTAIVYVGKGGLVQKLLAFFQK